MSADLESLDLRNFLMHASRSIKSIKFELIELATNSYFQPNYTLGETYPLDRCRCTVVEHSTNDCEIRGFVSNQLLLGTKKMLEKRVSYLILI
jgi:hypothetical protein